MLTCAPISHDVQTDFIFSTIRNKSDLSITVGKDPPPPLRPNILYTNDIQKGRKIFPLTYARTEQ
jgi:hypothetical protein